MTAARGARHFARSRAQLRVVAAAAPSTLRMRAHASGTHWSPSYWSKRVAQAAPDQPAADPPGDGAPPVPPPAEAPAPTPEAAPAPSVETTLNLTDAELQAIADQAAKEEVITVTARPSSARR